METVQITKEENITISQRIAEIVKPLSKFDCVLAIYLTCYKDKSNKNIIEINLIINPNTLHIENKVDFTELEKYDNTEIRITATPSNFYKIGYMTNQEKFYARELVNSTILFDGVDYTELRDSMKKFDLNPWENAITFEPPLELPLEITDQQNRILSQRIAQIVEKYSKYDNVSAIYLTCYKDESNKNIIEINLIITNPNVQQFEDKNNIFESEQYDNIEIRVTRTPSNFYKISYMTNQEKFYAKKLANAIILYDTLDYTELSDLMKKFEPKPLENAITFTKRLYLPYIKTKKPQ